MNYNRKAYPDAYNFYDSLDVNVLARAEDKERVEFRKPPLKTVAENTFVVIREDSLQALAKLPANERDAIIKKQEKLLRKAQGLKEEEEPGSVNIAVNKVPDLFEDKGTKGNEFYFYNASNKARGFSEFKARFGERPNVDNWRRRSSIDRQSQAAGDVNDAPTSSPLAGSNEQKPLDNSYEGLQSNIPLTEEKLDSSNQNIMEALFTLGQTFMSKLEEYPAAIQAYEELLRRFPGTTFKDEALFNLVYAYQKTGDKAKSDQYKNQLVSAGNNKWTNLIKNPPAGKNDQKAGPATKKYEQIYNLFIEGHFDQAKNEKKVADNLYGNSYWTPQLLFIESIYYIKQQEDSTAIKVLTDLTTLHAGNPMAEKAKTMINVLRRRKDIEEYLTKLDVKRSEGTGRTTPVEKAVATTPKPVNTPATRDTASKVPKLTAVATDSSAVTAKAPIAKDPVPAAEAAISDSAVVTGDTTPGTADTTAITGDVNPDATDTTPGIGDSNPIISDTNPVTGDSSTVISDTNPITADSSTIISDANPMTADSSTVISDTNSVPADSSTVISDPPPLAVDTTELPISDTTSAIGDIPDVGGDTAPIASDTSVVTPAPDLPATKDTLAAEPAIVLKNYSFVAADPQYVVILLDKVDPVYSSEARNAFNRFNREKYYNRKIEVTAAQIDERYHLVLQGPFANAAAALEYIDEVRPVVRSRVLPWLSADKYTFLLISSANLNVLKSDKDMEGYKQLLQKALPGKF
jgi:outer membrane protein assembly factor BamD (BamD/ComL family)